MGSKGSAPAPPPIQAPADNSSMLMMMEMMRGMNQQQPMMPQAMPTPEIESSIPVDWKSQMEDLRAKSKFDADAEDRKGRMSTIHSSLTDSDEETEMSTSLLGTE